MIVLADRPCWIFDLDGTLTEPVHDFDAIRSALDIPRGEYILEYISRRSSEEAAVLHARLQAIEADLVARTRLREGCRELLERLLDAGCRLGILTRNSHENALATLAHTGIDGCFEPTAVLGRDAARPKPDPEGIELLLRHWDASAETAVMVGDHAMDLRAGRRAGVMTVHLDPAGAFAWPADTDHGVLGFHDLGSLLG